MPDYSFNQLSPNDFEHLARDLLQKELTITFESFTTGKDKGVDLRFCPSSEKNIIVQCKHYIKTSFNGLLRAIDDELPKIKKLQPDKYIFVTSKDLTVEKKEKIFEKLHSHLLSKGDIYGKDDLNNLLGKFPEVEKEHFKLWLTSTTVLEHILNAGIFGAAQAEIEHIKLKISRFVKNESLNRTREVLKKNQFCIIAGIPGIGKTTLAEILLMTHLKNGYECYRIWNISEAYTVFNSSKKQLFYFDDFLGRTGLKSNFDKNEDERLIRFIQDVSRTEQSKLILTTREYILKQAKENYEALTRGGFDTAQSVIELEDYTDFIRAQILYNHLFFSELPHSFLTEIVNQKAYKKIIAHENYSPRIIEIMTELINVKKYKPGSYPREFIANLDYPYKIWQTAFHNHLSNEAVDILLVLSTLSDVTTLDILEKSFESFNSYRVKKYNREGDPYGFSRGLNELENNFIKISSEEKDIIVEYHNPSVRDFIENHLRDNHKDANELLDSVLYSGQVYKLWEIDKAKQKNTDWANVVLKKYQEIILDDLPSRYEKLWDDFYFDKKKSTYLERFIMFTEISQFANKNLAENLIGEEVNRVKEFINSDLISFNNGLKLLTQILDNKVSGESRNNGSLYELLYSKLFDDISFWSLEIKDYETLISFSEEYPDTIVDDTVDDMEYDFQIVAEEQIKHLIEYDSDINDASSLYDTAIDIAKRMDFSFEFDFSDYDKQFKNEIVESDDYSISHQDVIKKKKEIYREIDLLFEGLVEQ